MSSAITLTGVGLAANIYSGIQSSRQAGRDMDRQERGQREALDFRRKQYDRYLGLYGPIEERLAREAQSSQPLGYDERAARIKQNYAEVERKLAANPGGVDLGASRLAAFGQAADLSGAWAEGLRERRNLGLQLVGGGQIERSAEGVGRGMSEMADLYGNRANLYGRAAAESWQNVGRGLGQLSGQIASRWDTRQIQKAEEERRMIEGLPPPQRIQELPRFVPRQDLPRADGPIPTPWRG